MKINEKFIPDLNKIGDLSQLETITKSDLVNALNEILNNYKAVSLYESQTGEYGDITLMDSVENYSIIEIYFCGNDGTTYQSSVKVYNPSEKITTLTYGLNDATEKNIYLKIKNVFISGNKITNVENRYCDATIFDNKNAVINKLNHIMITKVLGYK